MCGVRNGYNKRKFARACSIRPPGDNYVGTQKTQKAVERKTSILRNP